MLTLPYPPSANRLWRIAAGRLVPTPHLTAWKSTCAALATMAGIRKRSGALQAELILHPRATRTGRASQIRLDLDNAIKATFDALNGIAWTDDAQVVALTACIGEPLPEGGVSITVEAA